MVNLNIFSHVGQDEPDPRPYTLPPYLPSPKTLRSISLLHKITQKAYQGYTFLRTTLTPNPITRTYTINTTVNKTLLQQQ